MNKRDSKTPGDIFGQTPKRPVTGQGNPLHDIVEIIPLILWKRKWIISPPILLGTFLGIFLAFFIRPLYKSSTLILIEPQQVSSVYVKSTDTTPVQARLNTLQQQIMSRTKLEKIIKEYDPYKEIIRKGWRGAIDHLFDTIKFFFSGHDESDSSSKGLAYGSNLQGGRVTLEEVERMRDDIKVKITGGRSKAGSVAFSITYKGTSPNTTMEVTNAITGLYIEENLKLREQYAEGTSDFLNNELERAKKELSRQENEVKVFKEKNIGALPGQLQANLRTLDRLQLDMQVVQSGIKDLQEELNLVKDQLNREKERKKIYQAEEEPGGVRQTELEKLNSQLKNLLLRFKENYPDVIMLKHRIKELDDAKQKQTAFLLAGKKPEDTSSNKFLKISDDLIDDLNARIKSTNYRIAKMKAKERKLAKKIKMYEKRVEETPHSEQILADIVRDYEISRSNYEALLEKKLNANMAENMEKRQKGERFRVVDPANFPEKPVKPKKIVLIVAGVFMGCAISGMLVFFLDFYKAVYRKAEDIYTDLQIPVLASIPVFQPKNRKKSKSLNGKKETVLSRMQALDSMVLEQYYVLFTKLMASVGEHDTRTFAVTSSLPGEGKTETALNLAYVIARQFKKRVVLVDCDLRKVSSFAPSLLTPGCKGLADIIKGNSKLEDTIVTAGNSNFSILPSYSETKNSIQLLDSKEFTEILSRLKQEYDYVILDSPPSLFLADAGIISQKSDAVLYVVRAGDTPKSLVTKGVHSFDYHISGIVLNGVDLVLKKKYFSEYA